MISDKKTNLKCLLNYLSVLNFLYRHDNLWNFEAIITNFVKWSSIKKKCNLNSLVEKQKDEENYLFHGKMQNNVLFCFSDILLW